MSETEASGYHPTLPEDLRVLKSDDTFLVEGSHGSYSGSGAEGVYHRNCRVVASSILLLDERPMVFLGDSLRSERSQHRCDFTNHNEWKGGGDLPLSQGALLVSRTKTLDAGRLDEDLRVRNYSTSPVRFRLHLLNTPDFADIFEVRNWLEPWQREATFSKHRKGGGRWEYPGQDGQTRSVGVEPTGERAQIGSDGGVTWHLEMASMESLRLRVSYHFQCGAEARTVARKRWAPEAEAQAENAKIESWLVRSRQDLAMLCTATREGPFPYAGVPWFSAMFGRDALITAHETLWLWPEIAAAVLRGLARHQAQGDDPSREEQKGKVLHEARFSERTNLEHVPFGRYYGAVDSAPLFVMLAAAYYRRTGDRALLRGLRDNLEQAVRWMEGAGAPGGDGLLRYQSHNRMGLTHQGWRDAEDALFLPDGRPLRGPIALVEAQAYGVAAWRGWSDLLRLMYADESRSEAYLLKAEVAAEALRKHFWSRKDGCFLPALDGASRPTRFLCSSAGHVLWAGAARAPEALSVTSKLFSPPFWSGWGVRTVAKGQPRYNPLSYHNGAVWPHDTMLCAVGAARYGDKRPALMAFDALLEVAAADSTYRLAELFSGLTRQESDRKPLRFATACSPQAWACAVPYGLLQAMLGLEFCAISRRVVLRHPVLPDCLPALTLRGLKFCEGELSLTLRRDRQTVTISSVEKPEGVSLEVVM